MYNRKPGPEGCLAFVDLVINKIVLGSLLVHANKLHQGFVCVGCACFGNVPLAATPRCIECWVIKL